MSRTRRRGRVRLAAVQRVHEERSRMAAPSTVTATRAGMRMRMLMITAYLKMEQF